MKFSTPNMAEELPRLPVALRQKLLEVDAWLTSQGWPDLFLTRVGAPEAGEPSWHALLCAVDIRSRAYSRAQRRELLNRLRFGTNAVQWEVLEEQEGTALHLHVAFKDFSRRKAAA